MTVSPPVAALVVPTWRSNTTRSCSRLSGYCGRGGSARPSPSIFRLVHARPCEWNVRNAFGDLFAHKGETAEAVEQLLLADHLAVPGFLPRATVLYRRIRKVDAAYEPAGVAAWLEPGAEAAEHLGRAADAMEASLKVAELLLNHREVRTWTVEPCLVAGERERALALLDMDACAVEPDLLLGLVHHELLLPVNPSRREPVAHGG